MTGGPPVPSGDAEMDEFIDDVVVAFMLAAAVIIALGYVMPQVAGMVNRVPVVSQEPEAMAANDGLMYRVVNNGQVEFRIITENGTGAFESNLVSVST